MKEASERAPLMVQPLSPGLVPMGKDPAAAGLSTDPFTARAPAFLENCR
jgi:hypothetical protein